jgi:hypothetical protein
VNDTHKNPPLPNSARSHTHLYPARQPTGTYENFLQQVNLAEQLTSSDFGVSTGLISQGYWEASKWYFVNVERGNIADKLQPRNMNVSFNNNSNVPIDVIIFTFQSDQLTIDVETGIVTK